MTVYVSLARGINVGGKRAVKMDELARLYASLGFTSVRTYLQSGNVIFESVERDPRELSVQIGENLTKTLGFPVTVITRTADELRHIARSNPFLAKEEVDETKLHVTFLAGTPRENADEGRIVTNNDGDSSVTVGREVYLLCPNGYGRTRLSNSFFERLSGVAATTRNWRTVTALSAIADSYS